MGCHGPFQKAESVLTSDSAPGQRLRASCPSLPGGAAPSSSWPCRSWERPGCGARWGEHRAMALGSDALVAHTKMNVGRLFQDVNISELMKKLDILGDNGVTMTDRLPVSWSATKPLRNKQPLWSPSFRKAQGSPPDFRNLRGPRFLSGNSALCCLPLVVHRL